MDKPRKRSVISILEVPPGTVHIVYLAPDGIVSYTPAVLVAYTTFDDLENRSMRASEGLPFIYEVYSTSREGLYWQADNHSNNRSGRCSCGDRRCRQFGITSNGREVDSEMVSARLEALSKLPTLKRETANAAA